jgi:hypothetical protein
MQKSLNQLPRRPLVHLAKGLIMVGVSLAMTFGWQSVIEQSHGMTAKIEEESMDVSGGGGDGELIEEAPDLQISDYLAGEIKRQGGAALPILVPYDMSADEETAKAHGFKIKLTKNGYTAVMRDGDRDIVINGVSKTPAPWISRFGGGSNRKNTLFLSEMNLLNLDYMRDYEDFDDGRGGSISFGYGSCDYQVEFYCKSFSASAEVNCIEAIEASEFVVDLVSG